MALDIDPVETVEEMNGDDDKRDESHKRLNAFVAVTVAILATFLGICNIKDDNIVQAMQLAQADKIDMWGFYQARNLREEIALATVEQLQLARLGRPEADRAAYDESLAKYRAIASRACLRLPWCFSLATTTSASR